MYIHSYTQVLHRDLKPANVFLDGSGNVKLGDFGLARILHHNFSLAQIFVGTPYYMSPVRPVPIYAHCMLSLCIHALMCMQEVFSEQAYDDKSDLWSLGCLLYELCTLSPPFTAKDQQTLATKVLNIIQLTYYCYCVCVCVSLFEVCIVHACMYDISSSRVTCTCWLVYTWMCGTSWL